MRNSAWLAVLLFLVGCGSSENASERVFLTVGTAPPGGAFFVVGSAIAEVAQSNAAELSWQVSAQGTKGTQENIRRLQQGDLQFALANAAISYFAVRGEGIWKTPHSVRSVMTLAPNVALFVTPADSGIKTIADLKGKRVVVGPNGAGFEHFIAPILTAHGLSYQDFTPLHQSQQGAVALLADGSADAAFLGGAVPTASIVQACATREIHFIPFTAKAREKLVQNYSFFTHKEIPAGTYKGQTEAYAGLNVGNMHLVTADSMDEEVVYQFTKRIYENAEQVVARHPAGRAINPANVVRDTGTPFHAGAIRYYKEVGIWPSK